MRSAQYINKVWDACSTNPAPHDKMLYLDWSGTIPDMTVARALSFDLRPLVTPGARDCAISLAPLSLDVVSPVALLHYRLFRYICVLGNGRWIPTAQLRKHVFQKTSKFKNWNECQCPIA